MHSSNQRTQLWMIWGALFFSVFVYGVVAAVVGGDAAEPPLSTEDKPPPLFRNALIILAFINAFTTIVIRYIYHAKVTGSSTPLPAGLPRTVGIFLWALCESVAVIGLIATLLGGGGLSTYMTFGLTAVVLFIIHRPSFLFRSQGRGD